MIGILSGLFSGVFAIISVVLLYIGYVAEANHALVLSLLFGIKHSLFNIEKTMSEKK